MKNMCYTIIALELTLLALSLQKNYIYEAWQSDNDVQMYFLFN
jgi:hypothetical protein